MTTSVYQLKLHEVMQLTPISAGATVSYWGVMRVPGGWIYQLWSEEKQVYVREVFVPFDNEFQLPEEIPISPSPQTEKTEVTDEEMDKKLDELLVQRGENLLRVRHPLYEEERQLAKSLVRSLLTGDKTKSNEEG